MFSNFTLVKNEISTYGIIVMLGIAIVSVIGMYISSKRGLGVSVFLLLELFSGISAVLGAKLWYTVCDAGLSESSLSSFFSFNGGLSFFGALLFGIPTTILGAKILKIDMKSYTRYLIFLIPLLHAFWKCACFCGGCCYGIEYAGIAAVRFPEGVTAPAGISLFPAQLAEAALLIVLAVYFYISGKLRWDYPILKYLMSYSFIRFWLEFVRNHKSIPTAAQIVSTAVFISALSCYIIVRKKRKGEQNGLHFKRQSI